MPTSELIEIPQEDIEANPGSWPTAGTFVAVDITEWSPLRSRQIVGTVLRWEPSSDDGEPTLVLQYADSPDTVEIALSRIEAAYFAPMGYRP